MLDQLRHLIRSNAEQCIQAERDRYRESLFVAQESHYAALQTLITARHRQEQEAVVYCFMLRLIDMVKEAQDG